MPKLNQIVAVEKGLKGRTSAAVTRIYHDLQKPPLFAGLSRTYKPVDDDGERFPPESTLVQHGVEESLTEVGGILAKLFDVVATKEVGNMVASAAVVVDGQIVVPDMPVPFLLFLEKQLNDMRTIISKVPVLDPSEVWQEDVSVGGHRTVPAETTRTRKVPKVLVKYDATDKHPAQTEVYTVDEIVGRWETTKFSGAISQARKDQLLARIDTFQDAVKKAREEANAFDVQQMSVGEAVFAYLLAS